MKVPYGKKLGAGIRYPGGARTHRYWHSLQCVDLLPTRPPHTRNHTTCRALAISGTIVDEVSQAPVFVNELVERGLVSAVE